MSDNEIRIAIAEACGWKWYRRPATGPWADRPYRSLYHPSLHADYIAEQLTPADMTERQCNEVFMWREGMIPDYPTDLNAMHEAEKTLTRKQGVHFRLWLSRNSDGPNALFLTVEQAMCHAAAHQRAEAFLRAIGRWRDQ